MPATMHVATIAAYERKESLGGGFRGVFKNHKTEERTESDILPTLEAATFWAKSLAHETFKPDYSLAPLRRKGEYNANVWVRV